MSQVASGRRTPQNLGGGNKKKNKNKHGKQTPTITVVPEEPTPTPPPTIIEEKIVEKEAVPVVAIEEPVIVIEDIATTNGSAKVNGSEPVVLIVEEKKRVRGSPRQSPRVTSPKKAEETQSMTIDLTEEENKEVEATVKALEQNELNDVSLTPPEEEVEAPKVVEEPPKAVEEPPIVVEETTVVVEEPKVVEEEKPVEVVEETSPPVEKENEEMEALVVDPADYEEPPTPEKPSGLSRFFRLTSIKKNKEDSMIVNLSTASSEPTSTDDSQFDYNRPIRGRRSTRAMNEIEFTYKKAPPANLDDTSSSMNVTVGSEIHNDSLRTPATNRKRKDMTPESTTDIVMESPKRARLDLSGLFTVMASPVTMLKNRFSRVKLQSSTPNKNEQVLDEVAAFVTAEATTTTNISGDNEVKMETEESEPDVKEAAEVVEDNEAPIITDASIAEEATESVVGTEQNQKLEEIDLKEDAKTCDEEPINVKETVAPAHRQWCNIM